MDSILTNHQAALADRDRTEAARKRDGNAALCRWLGIPAKREWWINYNGTRYGNSLIGGPFLSKIVAQQSLEYGIAEQRREEHGIPRWLSATVEEIDIYPALDTREGFWLLWDALKAKGYTVSCSGFPTWCEATILEEFEVVSNDRGKTEQAALYAAAQALRKREGASE